MITKITVQTKCPSCQSFKDEMFEANVERPTNVYFCAGNVPSWVAEVFSKKTCLCDSCGTTWMHVPVTDTTEEVGRIELTPKQLTQPTK